MNVTSYEYILIFIILLLVIFYITRPSANIKIFNKNKKKNNNLSQYLSLVHQEAHFISSSSSDISQDDTPYNFKTKKNKKRITYRYKKSKNPIAL